LARRQLTIDNTVAAELAGSEDAVLRALEGHLDVDLYLRGNILTLDGDATGVRTAETVVGELVDLIEQGHEIAPGTIEAVTGALDKHESPAEILEDVVWQHRNTRVAPKTVNQKQYVDSIRRHTITFGIGPAGTGKTPAPPSRPASASAFCPATFRPRSTHICALSSTPSTTCSTPRRSTPTSNAARSRSRRWPS
jgi:phosphate starvation-inducible PhoH-like protein